MPSVSNRGPLDSSWSRDVGLAIAALYRPMDEREIRRMAVLDDPGQSRSLRSGERLLRIAETLWRSSIADESRGRFRVSSAEAGEAELFEALRHFSLLVIGDVEDYHLVPAWQFDIYDSVSPRHNFANALHRLLPPRLVDPNQSSSAISSDVAAWEEAWSLLRSQKIREGEVVPIVAWPSVVVELDRLVEVLRLHRAKAPDGERRGAPSLARRPPGETKPSPTYEVAQRLWWEQRDEFADDRDPKIGEFLLRLASNGYSMREDKWASVRRRWEDDDRLFWPPERPKM